MQRSELEIPDASVAVPDVRSRQMANESDMERSELEIPNTFVVPLDGVEMTDEFNMQLLKLKRIPNTSVAMLDLKTMSIIRSRPSLRGLRLKRCFKPPPPSPRDDVAAAPGGDGGGSAAASGRTIPVAENIGYDSCIEGAAYDSCIEAVFPNSSKEVGDDTGRKEASDSNREASDGSIVDPRRGPYRDPCVYAACGGTEHGPPKHARNKLGHLVGCIKRGPGHLAEKCNHCHAECCIAGVVRMKRKKKRVKKRAPPAKVHILPYDGIRDCISQIPDETDDIFDFFPMLSWHVREGYLSNSSVIHL